MELGLEPRTGEFLLEFELMGQLRWLGQMDEEAEMPNFLGLQNLAEAKKAEMIFDSAAL